MENIDIVLILGFGLFCYIVGAVAQNTVCENDVKETLEQYGEKTGLINEEHYKLGLVRGCDIGCIQYDLSLNNFAWETTNEEYNIFNSTLYKECSTFCIAKYGE